MKVKELLNELAKYNLEAEVEVVVGSTPKPFEICFGDSEGCTPATCDSVDFIVDSTPERGE